MKKNTQNFKKLTLKKESIMDLSDMNSTKGGLTFVTTISIVIAVEDITLVSAVGTVMAASWAFNC